MTSHYQLWGAPPPPCDQPMYVALCTTSQDVPRRIQKRLSELSGIVLKVTFQYSYEWGILLAPLMYLWLLPEDHDVLEGFSYEKIKYVTAFFIWEDQPLFFTRDKPNMLTCYAAFATPAQVEQARVRRTYKFN